MSPQDECAELAREACELARKARLARAVVAGEEQRASLSRADALELRHEERALGHAADERGPQQTTGTAVTRTVADRGRDLLGDGGAVRSAEVDDVDGAGLDRAHRDVDRHTARHDDDRRAAHG